MKTLHIALLALLGSGIGVRAADVSDLTYANDGIDVTITGCDTSASGALDIPDAIEGIPVRFIGNKAFLQCSRLTSITIPDGVTGIGNYTFYGCSSLTSITIPDGVTSIGKFAFYNCTTLSSITFLGDAPTLGLDAFSGLPEGARIIARTGAIGFGGSFGGLEVFYLEMNEPRKLEVKVSRSGADQIALSFPAAAGSTYSIQGSSDMKIWELLESEIAGAGDYVQKTFPISGRERFFRVIKR